MISTSAEDCTSKSGHHLGEPVLDSERLKPSSTQGENRSALYGVSPSGNQPSAISPVIRTFISVPVPSQIGMLGFMCRIDLSGLASPALPGPS